MTNIEYQQNIELLIKLVKVLQNVPENDIMWDKGNKVKTRVGIMRLWNMFKKSELLEYESIENIVASCIEGLAKEAEIKGHSWSISGFVMSNAWKWEKDRLKEIRK